MSRRSHMLVATEIALAIVTFAAVVGMHRLFIDGSYRGPLAVQVIAAHAVVAVLRRRHVPLVPAALVTAVAAVVVLTWAQFPDTVRYLLPTSDTWTAAGHDLRAAWHLFQDVKAPAPVENGFIVATGIAIWVLVYVADWAAFRAGAAFEALLPATTLFLFAAALGAPGQRVASAALFAAAALVFVLLHRTVSQEESSTWAATHRAHGRWSLLETGAVLAGVAVIAGALAGPRLPGAEAEPVLAWRDITKDEPTRVVVSPMIDLRDRIVNQPNVEVFTVRSSSPSYWRLTALDDFDGTIWRSSYGTGKADGNLPQAVDSSAASETVVQTIRVEELNSVWLPAAFEPVALEPGKRSVGWDEDSSTLIVDRDVRSSDGFSYKVTSHIPQWSAAELRAATGGLPKDIADHDLALPNNLSPDVRDLAARATADATTAYDKALALQNYLLHNYTYDQNVPAGHSSDALWRFLFEIRRGFCEQFAGSFAAMARSIGLPARVAVGFTWGIRDPNDPTIYRVRGVHAHAWPEVYFPRLGWVPFEPTPGRAPPGAGSWLGLPPQQDTAGGGNSTLPTGPGAAGGANPDPGGGPSGDERRATGDRLGELGGGSSDTGSGGGGDGVPSEVSNGARAVGIGLAAYLVLVPLAIVARRLFRRQRARTRADRLRLAWRETTDHASAAGVRLPASLTIAEAADRLSAALPDARPAIQDMARALELVAYADVAPSDDEVAQARHTRKAVTGELNRRQPWWRRVLRYFDVRDLRPRDRRVRLITQHQAVLTGH